MDILLRNKIYTTRESGSALIFKSIVDGKGKLQKILLGGFRAYENVNHDKPTTHLGQESILPPPLRPSFAPDIDCKGSGTENGLRCCC
jgi:hypothetical protein